MRNSDEVLKYIEKYRDSFISTTAQLIHYSTWTKELAREMLEMFRDEHYKEKVTIEELKQFSQKELIDLRFGHWKEDLILIPLYLIDILDPEMEVESIRGEFKKLKECDDDVRFGCIAYGFRLNSN